MRFFGTPCTEAQQVFDHVFELALALDHRAHALQLVGFHRTLHQDDRMALRHVIQTEALRASWP